MSRTREDQRVKPGIVDIKSSAESAMASLMKAVAKFCSGLAQFLFAQTSRPEPFGDTGSDSEMSSWHAHRQRQKAEAIEAEAEGMIHDFGVDAYSEARRREFEASSDARVRHWELVALAIARKTSSQHGLET